jgi:hypothetical protein
VIYYISQCRYFEKLTLHFTCTPPHHAESVANGTALDSRHNRNFLLLLRRCSSSGLGLQLAWKLRVMCKFPSPQSHVRSFYKDINPNRLLRPQEGVLLVSYLDPDQSIFVFHPGPVWIPQPIRIHHSVHGIIASRASSRGFWSRTEDFPPPAIDNTATPSKGIKLIHPSCSIRTLFDTTTISTFFRLTFAARCCNISHQVLRVA